MEFGADIGLQKHLDSTAFKFHNLNHTFKSSDRTLANGEMVIRSSDVAGDAARIYPMPFYKESAQK
jgi:hypothetical protein